MASEMCLFAVAVECNGIPGVYRTHAKSYKEAMLEVKLSLQRLGKKNVRVIAAGLPVGDSEVSNER